MAFHDAQNPGIGGLDELTNAEELFLTSFAGQSWVTGDLVYYDGATLTRLPIGTGTHVLTVSGGLPTWQAPTGGGGGVSDGDKGDITISGTGTVYTIDAGVVTLAKQADVGTGTVFYRKTAGTGVPEVQTLATLKTDLGLTGTNSGDQTSIVGITGTKSQFNTAVTDGDILYVGDITQYTDELAQDAIGTILTNGGGITWTYNDAAPTISGVVSITSGSVTDFTEAAQDATGAMIDSSLVYVDATPLLQRAALTGAITASAGSNATLLGSFTTAQLNTALSDNDIATGGGTATGTNTGDQTITLTGNVTGSGTSSFATTIQPGVVTLAMMANMATSSLIYRKTAGAGAPEVNTLATLKTDLGLTGTNSGDQTTIVGITGTKAQFNTAVTDGDILYVGDVTSNATHTGDVTGSTALTLDPTAITGKTLVTAVGTDYVLISDTSDSGLLKKALASDLAGSGGVSDGDKGDITISGTGTVYTIDNGVVTFAKMQAITDGVLLGASGGTTVEEITIGSGLSLAANTLSATGGGGGITQGQVVAVAMGMAMV